MRITSIVAVIVLLAVAGPANAYVGPGLGVGAVGVFFGVVLALFLGLFAYVWMPIKRLLGMSAKKASANKDDAGK